MFQNFMESHKYLPKTPQKFWCNMCDYNEVDSENPESGSFFVVFGHVYDHSTKGYDGEYMGTMFAVCPACS